MDYVETSKNLKLNKVPFNITFLPNDRRVVEGLLPVTNIAIMDNRTNDYHSQGLYSTAIFGKPGEKKRDRQMSYVPLRTKIFHPLYYKELIRLKGLYGQILMSESYAKWDEKEKDFVPAKDGILEGETGFSFFMRHWDELEFKQGKSQKRQLRITMLEHYRDVALIDFFMVIPAGLRDVTLDESNRPIEEDINGLYKKVISAANAINPDLEELHPSILDFPKKQLQKSVNAVDDYIHNILEGKRGFISGKFGSRKVFGTTRNVLSSMEMDAEFMGGPKHPDLNTTIVGMYQFIKAAEPLVVDYAMPKGFLSDFFDGIDSFVPLVNKDTLLKEEVQLSPKAREKWGTTKGLEDLLSGFKYQELRHNPVTIDGKFLKLIYQDNERYRIMNSIEELPDGWNKSLVRPLTWGEMFYLIAKDQVNKTRCYCTRYPVTGMGSIFPNKVYMRTTVRSLDLVELDENWNATENRAIEFPDTLNKLGWVDTMAVHTAYLPHLGADFDGDMLSFQLVYSDEAVKEVDDYLSKVTSYITPQGGLLYDSTSDVTEWVLSFTTGNGLEE
ncbi:hypothetical protein [Vibrio phage BONAISHI]|nr:hypothetical protein [Vibrio phage BONAISHI]